MAADETSKEFLHTVPGIVTAIAGIQVNGAAECSEMRLKNPECRAMTFVKHPAASGGIRWLKGSAAPTSDPNLVSAIKQFR